jgi:hypothetical protein
MAKLDRQLQRSILENLAEVYPGIARIRPSPGETEADINANLYYLTQHGLIDLPWTLMMSGERSPGVPAITAKGMDFLADDGGLSAILGVVTVKLHEDTIKALLIKQVEKAEGDDTMKGQLIAKIKEMPAEALSAIVQRALEAGLDQVPDLLGQLSKWLGL